MDSPSLHRANLYVTVISSALLETRWEQAIYHARETSTLNNFFPISGQHHQKNYILLKQFPQRGSTVEWLVSVVGSDYRAEVVMSPIQIQENHYLGFIGGESFLKMGGRRTIKNMVQLVL